MIEIRLGDRYAKSIIDLARERGEIEAVRNDFAYIRDLCKQSPDFLNMLKSPLINTYKKEVVIQKVLGGKLSAITANLVDIIVRKKREGYLPDIAERYLVQYDTEKNVTRGVLTSAAPLSEDQKARIRTIVERDLKTTFIVEEKIDPSLIGGFVLRIGDKLFDGSVAYNLRQLKQEFEKNPYIKLH
jgi:F-type H+-transporting ATPase subunit delta